MTFGIVKSAIVTNLRLRGYHRPVGSGFHNWFSTGLFHKLSYSGGQFQMQALEETYDVTAAW